MTRRILCMFLFLAVLFAGFQLFGRWWKKQMQRERAKHLHYARLALGMAERRGIQPWPDA